MKVRVASAGTGKTTSLVKRYLELIEEGVPLRRIAGVTFTRAATAELRQRVADGLEEIATAGSYLGGLHVPGPAGAAAYEEAARELGGTTITTIHGFMRAGLRLNAPLIGLDPSFTMLSEWEAAELFEEEVSSVRLLAQDPEHPLHGALLVAGDDLLPLALELFSKRSLSAELSFGAQPLSAALAAVFTESYDRFLGRLGGRSMGPGELERASLRLFSSSTTRRRLVDRFPVVLVDEYQDVNPLQGHFFERLAEIGVRLEVVGDPKQSIYGFRSADVGVFRRALDAVDGTSDLLEPLVESRRHSRALVSFLNRLTTVLAAAGKGFEPREAPAVVTAGSQADVAGSVRLLIAEGSVNHSEMRPFEADMLVEALQRANSHSGVAYDDMAVVARSNWLLGLVERALRARGVPSLVLKGSGLFEAVEIRDLRHALQVGVAAVGPSFASFLRGPFAGLDLVDMAAVLNAPTPLVELASRRPDVARTVAELEKIARLSPLDALKAATRSQIIDGDRYVDKIDDAARANLDAMLFDLSLQPPGDLQLLLDRLDDLQRRSDAAPVPESGSGVKLSTVHGSKGLEYPLVAIFDAGANERDRPHDVLVDARTGVVTLSAEGGDEAAQRERRERDRQETFRLLYVAASRARDTLLISGSVSRGRPRGWLEALLDLGLEGETALADVSIERSNWRPVDGGPPSDPPARVGLPSSSWVATRFEPYPHGRLSSPSRLVGLPARTTTSAAIQDRSPGTSEHETTEWEAEDEPLAWQQRIAPDEANESAAPGGDEDAGDTPSAPTGPDELPGRGRVLGTLVHFAISRDWTPDDSQRLAGLRTQEVMFPYDPQQQDELLGEVSALLVNYQALVGAELPALADRLSDRAEIPLAFRGGPTVWEGVIDRLYKVGDSWYLDDYKTDRIVKPERYLVQLGLYRHAVSEALGERPRCRLVYLRSRTIVEPAVHDMEAALQRSGIVSS